jgi:hypothetical protein
MITLQMTPEDYNKLMSALSDAQYFRRAQAYEYQTQASKYDEEGEKELAAAQVKFALASWRQEAGFRKLYIRMFDHAMRNGHKFYPTLDY